ncbi:MAG TPA: helix-turn-helix domain-containing protein [Dehalococcoidia bacterium]|nr:helix-turn-helix domain-containing protein [Dehalococcoidia bacterium]
MTVLRDQPEILTVEQTAALLQVSKETVYRYIRDGVLLASRIGRGYRVPRSNIERLLLSRRVRRDIQLRDYTDEELDQFLHDDESTLEQREIVARILRNAERRSR